MLAVIVTDNSSPYVSALDWLTQTYCIQHICISPYRIIEWHHFNICEVLVKSCEGDISQWSTTATSIFWEECITTHKATGYLPYYMAHSVEPLLPFDLTEATFLLPVSTTELIAHRTCQVQKCPEDLMQIKEQVLQA
ncbi:hypothetical protein ID866_13150 [Astraeus odoratus]|nr:hypothetical protein ID866_13150 [Astraeus odoratus]